MGEHGEAESADVLRGTKYTGGRIIGRGGMGEVVEATHRELGYPVVVKLIRDDVADAQLVERLRIEAQVVARLDHPHIVQVLDHGRTPDGRSFLVMERLRGRTLTAELNGRGPIPWREALEWAEAMLSALEFAHVRGVVHRDVKLDNVMLHEVEGRGRVLKLLDFGIAKLTEPTLGVVPSAHPTKEGWIVGSLRYAAPEQLLGLPIDARTDVYAVGVVLFALLSKRRPFEQDDQQELMRAQALDPAPRVATLARQALPRGLDAAIDRALAKKPTHRFPSAAAFADALTAICLEHDRQKIAAAAEEPVTREMPRQPEQSRADAPAADERRSARTTPAWLLVPLVAVLVFLVALALSAAAARVGTRLDRVRIQGAAKAPYQVASSPWRTPAQAR